MTTTGAFDLDVVTLGEAMVLFAADAVGSLADADRFNRFCAGAELNVAIGLARLNLRVGYLTRFGADSFGDFLRSTLARENIETRLVEIDGDHPTGFMLKSRAEAGADPRIEYHRRGSAASRMNRADLARVADVRPRVLHLTGISPALSAGCRDLAFGAIQWARQEGAMVTFDPNLRPQLWRSPDEMVEVVNHIALQSDLVMPGILEGRRLTGAESIEQVAAFYLDRGVRNVIVKFGDEGAWCASAQGLVHVSGFPVPRVVDTVGAGDGFVVGAISALLEGRSLVEATRRGNWIGARVVQFPGDSDGLPRRHELPPEL